MGERIAGLIARVETSGLDGLLVTTLPNLRYVSGFSGSSGVLLVDRSKPCLITDFRYETQAREELTDGIELRIAPEGLFAELARVLAETPAIRSVGFEPEQLSVAGRGRLVEQCEQVQWEPFPGSVEELRAVKDEGEIECIRRAAEIGDKALRKTLGAFSRGMTELELVGELEYNLRRLGSGPPAFESIVASGPRTALPHARPSKRRIVEGDFLLFDFGATFGGYCSDMSRTMTVGRASDWQRTVYSAVLEALDGAVSLVAAGRPARDVDAAARAHLAEAGLARHFGHGTGHGIGLEVHEAPRLHRSSDDVLEAGNVVTVEPGVYFPQRGGVRIEQDVIVECNDSEVVTAFPRDLMEI